MPEYLSPGVFLQEVDSGPRPIEGVGTACAAFVGFAPGGPTDNRPVLVTSWTQYEEKFGSLDAKGRRTVYMDGAYLSHAVRGYFDNGGGRCYITRISLNGNGNGKAAGDGTTAVAAKPSPLQLPSRASKAIPSLMVTPNDGTTQDIQVDITPAAPPTADQPAPPDGTFTIRFRMGDVEETYENVTLDKTADKKKGPTNVVEAVNAKSKVVTVADAQATGTVADRMPETGSYLIKATQTVALPPQVQPTSFTGNVAERSGVEGLEIADDVTMVCCPDLMAAYQQGAIDKDGVQAVQTAMITHCQNMGDRVAIIDPLPELSPQEVKAWRLQVNYDSPYAALYYPWISVAGSDGKPLPVPPCGHMAGLWARVDNSRGVHKAPANEIVMGALGVVTQVTKGEQDTLNPDPIHVNCIRSFPGRGVRVWGARTLSSDPAWRYINVRRLFNYVEKSIEQGTQWIVFEPNDPDLWARISRDVGAFLTGVWRTGALFGATADQAFFVKCDEELNPPDVRDRGELYIDVGLAPVKPAEFVIFRFRQLAGGGA